jgi:hypothetical protein
MEEKKVVSQTSERAPAATGEVSKSRYSEPRSAEVVVETLKFRHTFEVPKRHVSVGILINGVEERRRLPDYARFGEDYGCCSDLDTSGKCLGAASTQVGFFSRLWSMLFLFAILLVKPVASSAQAPQATGPARPCASSWNTSAPRSKKKPPKNAPRELQDRPACIEISASALDIQEYLQFDFRNQHWTIVEEHVTEDSWMFSLAMSKDDLLGATRAASSPVKVEWHRGMAFVQINSSALTDGFTRTVVRARFRGYGEAADKFAPQREHWELESNGTLEASIVSTLKARFKAAS